MAFYRTLMSTVTQCISLDLSALTSTNVLVIARSILSTHSLPAHSLNLFIILKSIGSDLWKYSNPRKYSTSGFSINRFTATLWFSSNVFVLGNGFKSSDRWFCWISSRHRNNLPHIQSRRTSRLFHRLVLHFNSSFRWADQASARIGTCQTFQDVLLWE